MNSGVSTISRRYEARSPAPTSRMIASAIQVVRDEVPGAKARRGMIARIYYECIRIRIEAVRQNEGRAPEDTRPRQTQELCIRQRTTGTDS